MAQFFDFREQAERCQRLARGRTDIDLRDHLLKLAEEYTTRVTEMDADGDAIRATGPDDQGAG